jgi:dGTPase
MGLYSAKDAERPIQSASDDEEPFRSPWRRDYARLIHCPAFRRLQGKTQVFPGHESDFYRNRLTHSLEVAQIAKSIAIRLNATAPQFRTADQKIEPEIVEFAGLAHDLGHPPFGHNGEEALDECMSEHGGFEGNAQSLRIVSRLEKKSTTRLADGEIKAFKDGEDLRRGLNLTYRSLAALLKYDRPIPERSADRPEPKNVMKGYYQEDELLVATIKHKVVGADFSGPFKTIECSIMDIADDIAYSTYDLEDNFKAGFLSPLDLFTLEEDVYEAVSGTINQRLAKQYADLGELKINPDFVKQALYFILEDLIFEASDEDKTLIRARRVEPEAKKMLIAADVQVASRRLAANGYYRVQFTSVVIPLRTFERVSLNVWDWPKAE